MSGPRPFAFAVQQERPETISIKLMSQLREAHNVFGQEPDIAGKCSFSQSSVTKFMKVLMADILSSDFASALDADSVTAPPEVRFQRAPAFALIW